MKEDKAAYFAQYWGQAVLSDLDGLGNRHLYPIVPSNMYRIEESHLDLKSLSSITDEDAIEVARIALNKDAEWKPMEIQKWDWCTNIIVNREPDLSREGVDIEMYIRLHFGMNDIEFKWDYNSDKGSAIDERHMPNAISVFDFLRSKSYALPFRNYSVEQLIEMGWLKLTNN